jgi:DNA polymerase-1
LFHNAKFDVEVAVAEFGFEYPEWSRIHDTLPMLFLHNPRLESFSLKPSSELLLDMPPEERDIVVDWLVKHQPVAGWKLSDNPRSKGKHTRYAGAYIALAPGDIVGKYAIGDTTRTKRLARFLYPDLKRRGMVDAYDLERELMPHLSLMEKQGVRVNVRRLSRDIELYEKAKARLEAWLLKKLRAGADFNLDSGPQLVDALVSAKLAVPEKLGYTPTGKLQSNKAALSLGVTNKQVLAALKYRSSLATCLRTFMRPWHATAVESGGYIYTTWNSTRTSRDAGNVGARTGRFSSTPNFQNLATIFEILFGDGKSLPKAPVELPPLPHVRQYVVPHAPGEKLIGRDFDGQELRVLAHYEDDVLREQYCRAPKTDLHQHVADQLAARGFPIGRRRAKTINFAIIYGVGLGKLAEQLYTTVDEAREIRSAYFSTFPSIRRMTREVSSRLESGGSIRTLAGREYYVEDPKIVNGKMRTFGYKGPNILIQGSSADLTKMAMVHLAKVKPKRMKLLLSVHDEIVCSTPKEHWREDMALMAEVMNTPRLDVPILSDGYHGTTWDLK